jgi:hypothetical protein
MLTQKRFIICCALLMVLVESVRVFTYEIQYQSSLNHRVKLLNGWIQWARTGEESDLQYFLKLYGNGLLPLADFNGWLTKEKLIRDLQELRDLTETDKHRFIPYGFDWLPIGTVLDAFSDSQT